jgi:hypothetical protein
MITRRRFHLMLLFIALAMTFLFWWPLYRGAGFIGGDLYPYFFPQKAFYADRLKAGEFPIWNDLTGFGYPILGESQTGAAYPFHLLFYRLFDLNTAYNIEHLLHYVICFVATSLFAKRLGMTDAGACFAAMVFTYGWFPPRACLEWAILTGAWLPLALWCVESFLQTRWWRYAIGLSFTLGMQLLAGHYHLAFITQLLVATYGCWRLWIEQRQKHDATCPINGHCGKRAALGLVLAGIAGIGLAGIQVLPTWELKQRSTRVITSDEYDPAYGHMPPLYASQLIAPWCWYNPRSIDEDNIVRDIAEFAAPWHWFGSNHDLDEAIRACRLGALNAGTNKIEAHVYCGMVPVAMALFAVLGWLRGSSGRANLPLSREAGALIDVAVRQVPHPPDTMISATTGYWLVAGLLAMVYATGWLLPIGLSLPGFNFFRGPGRYGIVTSLVIALLAGQTLSQFGLRASSPLIRTLVFALVSCSTCGDLWLVSRMVKYTYMTATPAISYRDASEVRKRLLAEPRLSRLLAPGPNVCNLLGVSCVPWYLGIAPAEYVDPALAMPPRDKPLPDGKPTPCSPELLQWLSQSGVTHVLNFEPLEETSWQTDLVWKGIDPFLNRVWGRAEPIYLYRFRTGSTVGDSAVFPGRAYLGKESISVGAETENRSESGSRRVFVEGNLQAQHPLILTELAYPGWTVTRNGIPVAAKQRGLFRAVDCPAEGGKFLWTYQPHSFLYGAIVSSVTLFVLATIAHLKFWHPKLMDRLLRNRREV